MNNNLTSWKRLLASLVFGSTISVAAFAGDLEPDAPPAPTMKTLDEVPPTWSQTLPAANRFKLVMGGVAVLDRETGLAWQRTPWSATATWANAAHNCYVLNLGGRLGWRLPTLEEFSSLLDPSAPSGGPFLPAGHLFTNVPAGPDGSYWTSTSIAGNPASAYLVNIGLGSGNTISPGGEPGSLYNAANTTLKTGGLARRRWCVRGGKGNDGQ